MTSEQIEKFFSTDAKSNPVIKISFKTRNTVQGIFIKTPDFEELKSKNFWRIVSKENFEQWQKSKDFSFVKMFHGAEFTKLAVLN